MFSTVWYCNNMYGILKNKQAWRRQSGGFNVNRKEHDLQYEDYTIAAKVR